MTKILNINASFGNCDFGIVYCLYFRICDLEF